MEDLESAAEVPALVELHRRDTHGVFMETLEVFASTTRAMSAAPPSSSASIGPAFTTDSNASRSTPAAVWTAATTG